MITAEKSLTKEIATLDRLLAGRLYSQFFVFKEIVNSKSGNELKAATTRYKQLQESIDSICVKITCKKTKRYKLLKGK